MAFPWSGSKQPPPADWGDWGDWFNWKPQAAIPKPKTPRLYISLSSEGYGHSSRAMAIAKHCGELPLLLGTYGPALERLQRSGYPCVEITQEVRFVGKQGGFDVGQTVLKNQSKAITFPQLIQEEIDILQEHEVSCVVADGRMAPVLAAAKLKLPCVVLTNQSAFYPFFAKDSPLLKALGLSFEWLMKLWLSSAEEIFIPDFPPPNSVCLPNLSGKNEVKKRTRFVGPLVAWTPEELSPPEFDGDTRPSIAVSLGGHSYRQPLLEKVLQVARAFPDWRFDIITHLDSASPRPENVFLHQGKLNAAPYFKAAQLVITQAGHSTAMELLTLGKPCLVVPDTKQTEQENNASRLAELGVAKTLTYGELDRLASVLQEALHDESMKAAAERLAQQAAELQGAKRTADLLKAYAQRLTAY